MLVLFAPVPGKTDAKSNLPVALPYYGTSTFASLTLLPGKRKKILYILE